MRDTRGMAAPLPRLRTDLDVMPSPIPDQPGLLVRDPFRYSEATLVVPPLLARCLSYFDGAHDQDDLRARLASLTGRIAVADIAKQLVNALSEAGFLDDERFAALREAREQAFAAGDERVPAHAGSGYPDEPAALRARLDGYHEAAPAQRARTTRAKASIGIAAPHVSPEGGYSSYAAAYRALPAEAGDRLFVVLGTSHYGEPDRFGLTRKPFSTPFGVAPTDRRVVDRLAAAAGPAVALEDYCHAVEHSIEFQVVFLQHRYGPSVPIVPVLCGAFWDGPRDGRLPDSNERVKRFIGALGDLAAREGRRLMFVLGVDFAHVGRRYGDKGTARAYEGALTEVKARDEARVTRIAAGDAEGFWDLVNEGGDDDLKWCGSSPLYTFLRAVPESRGRSLAYEQWNIDAASVVSFGALSFSSAPAKRS
jgi:AmmeMemoRadiSam system protein B